MVGVSSPAEMKLGDTLEAVSSCVPSIVAVLFIHPKVRG